MANKNTDAEPRTTRGQRLRKQMPKPLWILLRFCFLSTFLILWRLAGSFLKAVGHGA